MNKHMSKHMTSYTTWYLALSAIIILSTCFSVQCYTITVTNETKHTVQITTTAEGDECTPVEGTIEAQKNSSFTSPCKATKVTIVAVATKKKNPAKTLEAKLPVVLKEHELNRPVPFAVRQKDPKAIEIVQL